MLGMVISEAYSGIFSPVDQNNLYIILSVVSIKIVADEYFLSLDTK